LRAQRTNAPTEHATPSSSSATAIALRSAEVRSSRNTSTLTPAAISASAVRSQASVVRSLAKLNRGSGSAPTPYTERGQR
jgi:hypothetical protein